MIVEIKVPAFPESVTDGTIAAWHKQPGDSVRQGETLVDIETDKVVFDTPAEQGGMLQEILCREGDTVVSGQVIARIDTAAAQAALAAASAVAGSTVAAAPSPSPANEPAPAVSPSARRLIAERGIDQYQVHGTGKGGRILKEDVMRVLESPGVANVPTVSAAVEPAPALTPAPAPSAPPVPAARSERPEKRVPMTRLRARIAERLIEAQQTAAILTTFNEVNMQPVMDLRRRYREQFEQAHGVRLGFMSLFIKAVIEALKRFPEVNASIEGNDIVYHGYYDIGIAVGSPRGLVVPILRDADTLTTAEIELQISSFGEKARDGSLSIDEITGGTYTITNGGIFGSLLSTPILNPPQSAILGMHKIEDRPVVENGEIVVRPMMYVALSYDHRIIDGREAVQFLVTIKEQLEDPARILLGI